MDFITTVWKFTFERQVMELTCEVGSDAKPIHVGQDPDTGRCCVWVEHRINHELGQVRAPFRLRLFRFGTGFAMPEDIVQGFMEHVGSVVMNYGEVWHVYKETSP